MKPFYLLIVALFPVYQLNAQSDFPNGVYMSLEEVKLKRPSDTTKLLVLERTKGDILMVGGNDYKLVSSDNTYRKKQIKRELAAYSDGANLYINCLPLMCQQWYGKVTAMDDNTVQFVGGISFRKDLISEGSSFTPPIGGISGAVAATKRFLYELNLDTKTLRLISEVE